LFHLLTGATMLGPSYRHRPGQRRDRSGRLIFGAGVGVLVYVCAWGGYPDVASLAVAGFKPIPTIDYHYTRLQSYTASRRAVKLGEWTVSLPEISCPC
jgi:Na+-translocating ferredoxin:NAD+ oxidoreductase RnfD subunit